jgi:hypothetical protein
VELSFTNAEFAKLTLGRKPREYGDKWFVFYEQPWLYCHRAMTGACMFQVQFEPNGDGYRVREALVDRDCSKDQRIAVEELSLWLSALLHSLAGRDHEAREHADRLGTLWREAHAREKHS